MTRAWCAVVPFVLAAGAAAQPRTEIRFANGTNQIAVPPGAAVLVSVYATGMPNMYTPMPWTTPPGTGQIGQYRGFYSVFMDMQASGGGWSGLTIPPGMGYQNPPFGSAGTPAGSYVNGININVGFNSLVTGTTFLLWQGTITVGNTNVSLSTLLRPVGPVGQLGFEVGLSGIVSGPPLSHFLSTANGGGLITVCYPDCNGDGALTLADFGCFTTKFALGDLYADCNGDGLLQLSDFGCFQTKFLIGCP